MGYRALVVFLILAMVLSVAWMGYTGTELLLRSEHEAILENHNFLWNSGCYTISGRIGNGILEEMVIRVNDAGERMPLN